MRLGTVAGETRRQVLCALGGGLAAGALAPTLAQALPRDVAFAIRQAIRSKEQPTPGRVVLDLPDHSEIGTSVPVTVRVESPMTPDNYARAVHLFADANPRPKLLSAFFTPESGVAEVSTRIRLDGAQTVTAVAEMSDGSFWRADKHLTIAFGACHSLNVSGGRQKFVPTSRISVPPKAAMGEIMPVRTLITHPMETGFRLDAFNQWVPEHTINRLDCFFNDVEVFHALLFPAISANPYLAFWALAQGSGTFSFRWRDSTGPIYENSTIINVA